MGFRLKDSPYYYLGPELQALSRHVKVGRVATWQLDSCADIWERTQNAIEDRKLKKQPAALELYRLRNEVDELTHVIVRELDRQGLLDDGPEGPNAG